MGSVCLTYVLSVLYDPVMKTSQAIEYYGSATKLADALGITKAAVSQWDKFVPELRALQLERLTGGELKEESRATAA